MRTSRRPLRSVQALCCALLLLPGEGLMIAQEKPPAAPAKPPAQASAQAPAAAAAPAEAEKEEPKLSADQLESLVAPIALYPDPLLAQTLVASTYPLEIVQLQQWMAKHKDLKDKALADAVAKEPWDTSIQTMAATPEVVKRLADDIQWTTDLGNAFLAQQKEVMDAVQRLRKKAKDKGALETNEQQKVETKDIEGKTIIVVESANPEVIYVPSYSPTVVYGPPVYPYPPIYYPPYPPGAAFVSFSFGVMMGAAFWAGSCCGCGWGGGDIDINVNNNFNRNTNINTGGNNNWNHNPQHRGGAPYGDKGTASKYGGLTRGGQGSRPSAGQQGGAGTRGGAPGASQQGGAGTRGGSPSAGQQGGAGTRGGSPSAGQQGGAGTRGGSPSAGQQGGAGTRGGAGAGTGSNQIGSRDISPSSSSRGGGFGSSGGYSGSSARASSSRGHSSMGGRGGGGGGGGRRR